MFFVLPAELPSIAKVSVPNRVIAKVIDLLLVLALAAIIPYPLGALLGFIYSLFGDALKLGGSAKGGQSLGKRIMGLQVVAIKRGRAPASLRESALRNAPVGVATFFALIPVWGWLILGLVGIPLMSMEIYLMLSVETGHRLGDVMGDTEVIELPTKTRSKQRPAKNQSDAEPGL